MPRSSGLIGPLLCALVAALPADGNPSRCLRSNGTFAPCGPGNEQCAAHGAFTRSPAVPQYHLMDLSCGEQDPNGPIYDPVHQIYHHFYQKHVGEPNKDTPWLGNRNGPVWGHAVSRDLIKWAHMPVAIWNDEWFDNLAIYTGSATYVDGTPTIVYAAVGKPATAAYAFSYGVAVPCNRSDPLLTEWCKPDYSPIVNHTSDDPSSAWRVAHPATSSQGGAAGTREWRFIGPAIEYSSEDFVHWSQVGPHHLPTGDCPSLFPIDGPNHGTYPPPPPSVPADWPLQQQPHAANWSVNWTGPHPGVPAGSVRLCGTVDGGHDTSSVMCKDSTGDGKLHISEAALRARCEADAACAGYAQYLPASGQPGSGSYFRPVSSLETLGADPHWRTWGVERRGTPPPSSPTTPPTHVHKWTVRGVDFMQVGRWVDGLPGVAGHWEAFDPALSSGRRIDAGPFAASKDFWDPRKRRRILYGWSQHDGSGMAVRGNSSSSSSSSSSASGSSDTSRTSTGGCKSDGVEPGFNGCLSTQSLPRQVRWNSTLRQLVFAPLEEQVALRSTKLLNPALGPEVLAVGAVKALCVGKMTEVEVTFALSPHAARFGVAVNGQGGATGTFFYVDYKPAAAAAAVGSVYTVSVGATELTSAVPAGGTSDTLRLIAGKDDSVTIRVFVDNTVAECFWQDGRVAMTVPLTPTAEGSIAVAAAVGVVTLQKAAAWSVASIWVSPQTVLGSGSMVDQTWNSTRPRARSPTSSVILKTDDVASSATSEKHIDWYVGHDWNWQSAGSSKARQAALDFALSTDRLLVDGIFPSFVHLNCSTGLLPSGLNFSAYAPFIQAGIAVSPTLEGDPSCCVLGGPCPLFANRQVLAKQLLALAQQYYLSGYTQDWEFTSSWNHTGYNDTMAHVASVLAPHKLGLGNSISSACEANFGLNGAPFCAPAYRNEPWASVLTDMGTYSPVTGCGCKGKGCPSYDPQFNSNCSEEEYGGSLAWERNGTRGSCRSDTGNDPTVVQYCGFEGQIMNMLHGSVATAYPDRWPQLSPGLWLGDCTANGTSAHGWTAHSLRSFLRFLDGVGVTRLTVWCMAQMPCPTVKENCPWMYDALREWKQRGLMVGRPSPPWPRKTDDDSDVETTSTIATDAFSISFDQKGVLTSVTDKRRRHNVVLADRPVLMNVVYDGVGSPVFPSTVAYTGGSIIASFPGGADVTIAVKASAESIRFNVTRARSHGAAINTLVFVNISIVLASAVQSPAAAFDSDFALMLLPSDLLVQTQTTIPGYSYGAHSPKDPAQLDGSRGVEIIGRSSSSEGSLVGRTALLWGGRPTQMDQAIQGAERAFGLPSPSIGGHWAKRNAGQGYFLIDLEPASLNQTIAYALASGLEYICFLDSIWDVNTIGGHYNTSLLWGGLSGLSAAIRQINAAGLKAGMHTLSGNIAKTDRYVTPVPDKRLAKKGGHTLGVAVSVSDTTLRLRESPADLPLPDGVLIPAAGLDIQIDDEIVTYRSVSCAVGNFSLGSVIRGAYGTHPAQHAVGATVFHLTQGGNGLLPDPDSSLLDEIVGNILRVYNEAGFEMLYLDGLEGHSHTGPCGASGCTRAMFQVHESVWRQLLPRRDALVESSTTGGYLWHLNARSGQADWAGTDRRAYMDFARGPDLDFAKRSNLVSPDGGWWAFNRYNAGSFYATTPDEMNYMAARMIGWGASLGLEAATVDLVGNGRTAEALAMMRPWFSLNRSALSDSLKSMLTQKDVDYAIHNDSGILWLSQGKAHAPHVVDLSDNTSMVWSIPRNVSSGTIGIRMRALTTAHWAAVTGPPNKVLLEAASGAYCPCFRSSTCPGPPTSGTGTIPGAPQTSPLNVTTVVAPPCSAGDCTDTKEAFRLALVNPSSALDVGCWRQRFAVPVNLAKHRVLLAHVYGDGSGALLSIQLEDGTVPFYREFYINVNFMGWRAIRLQLPETRGLFSHAGGPFPKHFDRSLWNWADIRAESMRTYAWEQTVALNLFVTNAPRGCAILLGSIVAVGEEAATLGAGQITVTGSNGHSAVVSLPAGLLQAAPCSPVGNTFEGCADYVECSDITNSATCKAFDANGFALKGGVRASIRTWSRRITSVESDSDRVDGATAEPAKQLRLQYVSTNATGRLEVTVFEAGGARIGPLLVAANAPSKPDGNDGRAGAAVAATSS